MHPIAYLGVLSLLRVTTSPIERQTNSLRAPPTDPDGSYFWLDLHCNNDGDHIAFWMMLKRRTRKEAEPRRQLPHVPTRSFRFLHLTLCDIHTFHQRVKCKDVESPSPIVLSKERLPESYRLAKLGL